MFTGVLVTEKHGQIFTGGLKVCNEDEASFVRHFISGRFRACPEIQSLSGTDFAPIFSPGKLPMQNVSGHLDGGVLFVN